MEGSLGPRPFPRQSSLHLRICPARSLWHSVMLDEQHGFEPLDFGEGSDRCAQALKKIIQMRWRKTIADTFCLIAGHILKGVRLSAGAEFPASVTGGVDASPVIVDPPAAFRAFIGLEYGRSGRSNDPQARTSARCRHPGHRQEYIRSTDAIGEIAGPILPVGYKKSAVQRYAQWLQVSKEIFRTALKIGPGHDMGHVRPQSRECGCGFLQWHRQQSVVACGRRKTVHSKAYLRKSVGVLV